MIRLFRQEVRSAELELIQMKRGGIYPRNGLENSTRLRRVRENGCKSAVWQYLRNPFLVELEKIG